MTDVLAPATNSDRPDCVFYMSGHCKRGDQCEYRHAPAARYATVVCKFWTQGKCSKADCAYLHPANNSNNNGGGGGGGVGGGKGGGFASPVDQRALTPCYWLTQPGGCNKGALCPYLHPADAAAVRGSDRSSNVTWSSHSLARASDTDSTQAKRVGDIDTKTQSHAQSILSRVSVSAAAAENDPVTFSRKHGARNTDESSSGAGNGGGGGGDLRALLSRGKKTTASDSAAVAVAAKPTKAAAAGSSSGPFVKKLSELMGAPSSTGDAAEASQSETTSAATTAAVDIEALKEKNKRKFGIAESNTAKTTATTAATTTTTTPSTTAATPAPTIAAVVNATAAAAPPPSNVAKKPKTEPAPTKPAATAADAVPDATLDDLDADLAAIDSLLA
jgi:hypothetical protein